MQNGNGTIRFGPFEADLHAGEVRKEGHRIKLQDQPFKVLQVLLERPGDLVTRDELQARIWPRENYGDFDHAVNVAVGKLRTALGDSADSPAFIETVPRRGYRFVAKLDAPAAPHAPSPPSPPDRRKVPALALGAVAAIALLAIGALVGRRTTRPQAPEFQRLTVQRGTIFSARFAPDGHSVVYAAAWDGAPMQIYSTDLEIPGQRSLGLMATDLLAVSPSGAMAVLQSVDHRFLLTIRGTLGQVSLSGGSPRPIADRVEWADWSPDGKTLAIVRDIGGRQRLEFPLGHVLFETAGWIGHPRVSPNGKQIAFLDHEAAPDDHGGVSVVDLSGQKRVLTRGYASAQGLAWAPGGREVWFSAAPVGLERRVYAVDLAGHQRLVYRAPGGVTLQDIAPDGRLLITRDECRGGMMAFVPGATAERDLTWQDWSLPIALSADGKTLLFSEEGEQSGPTYTVAIRDTRGSSPIALGDGMAGDLSPDGKWATSVVASTQIMLLPTGVGSAKRVARGDIQQYWHGVRWMPDGKHLLFAAVTPGHAIRCFVQSVDSAAARALTPDGVSLCQPSPDGRSIAGNGPGTAAGYIYALDGSAPPLAIPGVFPGENFEWTSDPRYMYVFRPTEPPIAIYRLDLLTGKRRPLHTLQPADATGLGPVTHVLFSADERAYVYSYARLLSELYLVKVEQGHSE